MNNNITAAETRKQNEERIAPHMPGMPILILNIVVTAALTFGLIRGAIWMESGENPTLGLILLIVGIVWYAVPFWVLIMGLKIVKPNEAYVFTLFGKYHGSLIKEGFYLVNPFVSATNPLKTPSAWEIAAAGGSLALKADTGSKEKDKPASSTTKSNRISLKVMTLNNNKQKITSE